MKYSNGFMIYATLPIKYKISSAWLQHINNVTDLYRYQKTRTYKTNRTIQLFYL